MNTINRDAAEQTSLPELTQEDISLMRRIKRCVLKEGQDVEVRKAPGGKLKVLAVTKKNITGE